MIIRWEYQSIDAGSLGSTAPISSGVLDRKLNELGQEGWEVYSASHPHFFLKRRSDSDADLFSRNLQDFGNKGLI